MTNKLYVGNLNYAVTENDLSDLFSQAGTVVSAKIIIDRDSGRSKGFAFVEMSNEDEAQSAIEMFHEQDFEGRTIVVNEARPQKPREFKPRKNYDRQDSGRRNRY